MQRQLRRQRGAEGRLEVSSAHRQRGGTRCRKGGATWGSPRGLQLDARQGQRRRCPQRQPQAAPHPTGSPPGWGLAPERQQNPSHRGLGQSKDSQQPRLGRPQLQQTGQRQLGRGPPRWGRPRPATG